MPGVEGRASVPIDQQQEEDRKQSKVGVHIGVGRLIVDFGQGMTPQQRSDYPARVKLTVIPGNLPENTEFEGETFLLQNKDNVRRAIEDIQSYVENYDKRHSRPLTHEQQLLVRDGVERLTRMIPEENSNRQRR